MQIKMPEGHTIQMLTEPGIVGKIGLNSQGLGTCLNILTVDKPLNGVPIHIVLRSILEARSLEEAKAAVRKSGYGKASNILFGDQNGRFCDVEFAGDQSFTLQDETQFMVHTNHFLSQPINANDEHFRNSTARYRVAVEKASALSEFSIDKMKAILTDRSDPEFPIWRTYQPDDDLLDVGTVATIVMDLKAQQLHIRKGNLNDRQKDGNGAQNTAEACGSEFRIAFES
jgi:isopenicillin-N N-acyltransferase-like protein